MGAARGWHMARGATPSTSLPRIFNCPRPRTRYCAALKKAAPPLFPPTFFHPASFVNKVAARLLVLGAVWAAAAQAQEESRPSLTRQKVVPPIPTDANVKVGPVLFRFSAALRTEFVDNVNLANGQNAPIESDIILSPSLGIDAVWPVTKLNILRFHTTLGLSKYLSHSQLGTNDILISPDSELRFDIYAGDFKFNLHDQFSLQEDPVGQGALSNVSRFGRFINTAGLGVLWDLNDVVVSTGFDHTSFTVTGATTPATNTTQNTSALDRTTDQVSASAVFNVAAAMSAGLESVASISRYPDAPQNDGTRVSAGPFIQLLLTRYTRIYAAAGYQGTFFDDPNATSALPAATTQPIATTTTTTSPNSYYASLTVTHRLNRYYQDRLSVGHESQLGLFSQKAETNYVNYASLWQLSPVLALSTTFFFEDTIESGAQSSVPYQRFGLSLSTGYRITKKLSASVLYQFVEKTSANEAQSYRQNRVGLGVSYQF